MPFALKYIFSFLFFFNFFFFWIHHPHPHLHLHLPLPLRPPLPLPPSPISHSRAEASFEICPEDHSGASSDYIVCIVCIVFSISMTNFKYFASVLHNGQDSLHKLVRVSSPNLLASILVSIKYLKLKTSSQQSGIISQIYFQRPWFTIPWFQGTIWGKD